MPPPVTFEVEKWMDEHEMWAKYQLAETCCASVSLAQLLALATPPLDPSSLLDMEAPQTYGEIRGHRPLLDNIASLYRSRFAEVTADHVLICTGAIGANHLAFYALLQAGDNVVCQYPTYQQLYSGPASLGADVSLWRPESADGNAWAWNVEDLKGLVTPKTKMIVLNNPNNPTGAILSREILEQVIQLARPISAIILSDEVYRPIFHSVEHAGVEAPPSIAEMDYERAIVTGSLSKAYALAGIRVGWLVSRSRDLLERLAAVRHYTAISVSAIDQQVAALATSPACIGNLLKRNVGLARTNVELLAAFVRENAEHCEWVRPVAGTTAFVKIKRDGRPVDDTAFCEALQRAVGAMLLPGGRCFGHGQDFAGYVRVGFVNPTGVVRTGLEQLRLFLQSDAFRDVPVVDAQCTLDQFNVRTLLR